MRLKLFFLGMFAAATFISCNNDVNEPDRGQKSPVPEGIPVYASVGFNVKAPNTYAGVDQVPASADETAINDGAMYIYNFASGNPEVYVYVPSVDANSKITMLATSGAKKIFVAVNIKQGTKDFSRTTGTLGLFSALNNKLYANGTSWDLSASSNDFDKADGLIKGLAMGDIYGTAAGDYSGTGALYALMTNWDGPDDHESGTPSTNPSNCAFSLLPDIDSIGSNTASINKLDSNSFDISVQRAYSKISLTISVATVTSVPTTTGFTTYGYPAAVGTDIAGSFQPWTVSGDTAIWSLGNIHKETSPFQQFIGSNLRDLNYNMPDDSISNFFTMWRTRYDNTRVFMDDNAISSYPSTSIDVQSTWDNMILPGNFTALTNNVNEYAYAIENAREVPVTQDYGTYVAIGGRYNPASIITVVTRANIAGNTPPAPTVQANRVLAATDTMYYVRADKVFILGKANLLKYYAWHKRLQDTANPDGDYGQAAEPIDATTLATVNDLIDKILDKQAYVKEIYEYAGGICWYRVFISDKLASLQERNVVRRNHIYAVDFTKINGPGIDDPNNILIPSEPIEDIPTFVTANITILPWHKVDQGEEVGY